MHLHCALFTNPINKSLLVVFYFWRFKSFGRALFFVALFDLLCFFAVSFRFFCGFLLFFFLGVPFFARFFPVFLSLDFVLSS